MYMYISFQRVSLQIIYPNSMRTHCILQAIHNLCYFVVGWLVCDRHTVNNNVPGPQIRSHKTDTCTQLAENQVPSHETHTCYMYLNTCTTTCTL